MSRAYRIKVSESLNKVIRAEDHVKTELELLNILPSDQMGELLAGALEKDGFEREGDVLKKVDGDVTVTVDVKTGEVTVQASDCEELELKGQGEGRYYDDVRGSKKQAEKQARDELKRTLEDDANAKEEVLQQKMTDQLERKLSDIRQQLDKAVNKVTAEALKQKAAQIGQIKEMTEDPEAGSLTIVVEV